MLSVFQAAYHPKIRTRSMMISHITFTFLSFESIEKYNIYFLWFLPLPVYLHNYQSIYMHTLSEGNAFQCSHVSDKGTSTKAMVIMLCYALKSLREFENLCPPEILISPVGGLKSSPGVSIMPPGLRITALEQPFKLLKLPFYPSSMQDDYSYHMISKDIKW